MKGTTRTAVAMTVAVAIAVGSLALATPYWTAAALIARASGAGGWTGTLARWNARPLTEHVEQMPVRSGVLRTRIFRPVGVSHRSALLVGGVHRDGIDEPRLVALARELAATGVKTVTPEIDDLVHYRLTARVTDAIEEAATAIVESAEKGTGKVGLIGVSFSGGLSVVAAGRPGLRDRVAYVMSFGGHGNLPRVLRYLCTGIEPAVSGGARGQSRPPHDYAVAVLLHQAAELLVPDPQIAPLRQGIELFLEASALKRTSPTEAGRLFEAARHAEEALPEPSLTLMKHVNDRDVARLGARIAPYLDRLSQDPSLSPDRAPPPSAPVYLLHGADDNVIPAAESALLSAHLRGHTRVRLLLSGYLTHADLADRPTPKDTWDMIAFWKGALSE